MTAGLAFTETTFRDIHITYIRHNIVIIRQNGVSDNMYKVKINDDFSPAVFENDYEREEDEDHEVSDPLSNFDIVNIINTNPSDESAIALQILCTSILETIRFKDNQISSLLVQLPSKLFSNVESKHDTLMEILSNINKIAI